MGFYSIVAFFQKGGLFMYPIMLVFAVGMAITIERWLQLSRTQSVNSKMWDQVHPVLAEGEFDKAREIVKKDKSKMAKMLEMGLARQGAVRRRRSWGSSRPSQPLPMRTPPRRPTCSRPASPWP